MTPLPSQRLMRQETRVSFGPAPQALRGDPLPERTWQLDADTFLMRADGAHFLHYRRGRGITIDRGSDGGSDSDLAMEALWLAGTLHAAIACLNGLIPLHASAIAHAGQVYAFTGASGAGKSTLIAALGLQGLPMLCDDTLVLDPDHDRVLCLPGHKRLKLSDEAIALTGATAQEPVGTAIGKRYAIPPAGDVAEPLPLATLFVLEDGDTPAITALRGGAKLHALLAEHYTIELLAAAGRYRARTVFQRMAELATRIAMVRFTRPRDITRLGESAAFVADWVRDRGTA